jgi:hypothetical protein
MIITVQETDGITTVGDAISITVASGSLTSTGGGAVDSVNGHVGVVNLDADDIADGTTNHAFTAADDTKLAGIATGATANSADATLLARANHTGTQAISTVTGLQTALDGKETAGAAAAAQAASQPVDSDLTAIAALTTTSYGRALLALADAAAGRTALGLGTAAVAATGDFDASGAAAAAQAASQPLDSDLTAIAALSTTSYGRSLLAAADASALRTLAGLVLGTDVYSKSATDSTFAPLASPAFTGNPTAPTPTAGDNDTSLATTAFVTTAVAAGGGGGGAWSRSSLDATVLALATSWASVDSSKDIVVAAAAGDILDIGLINYDVAQAASTLLLSENFNRVTTNNTLGAPQVGTGPTYPVGTAWGTDGTKLNAPNATDVIIAWDLGVPTYDLYHTVIGNVAADGGPIVRYTSTTQLYLINLSSNTVFVKNPGYSSAGTLTSVTWAAGDVCKVSVTATSIQVFRQAGGSGAFTSLGTVFTTTFASATRVGYRSTGSPVLSADQLDVYGTPDFSLANAALFDVVTLASGGTPNRSVFSDAAAPTGTTGEGGISAGLRRSTGSHRAHYVVQASDVVSGNVTLRALYRSPSEGRTLTRARLVARKI